jgi:hypothetical protein
MTCPLCNQEKWEVEILTTIDGVTGCTKCIKKLPPRDAKHAAIIEAYEELKRRKAQTYDSYEERLRCVGEASRRWVRLRFFDE